MTTTPPTPAAAAAIAPPTPCILATLAALADRGACLTMPEPGRLAVCPADAATPAELAALRDARPWLLAAWQAAAAWDARRPPRPGADPLPGATPDAAADDGAWAALLMMASAEDGRRPFGVTGALRFARSMGARLRWTPAGSLALRMPTGHPEAFPVATALYGRGEHVSRLLDLVAADPETGGQRAA